MTHCPFSSCFLAGSPSREGHLHPHVDLCQALWCWELFWPEVPPLCSCLHSAVLLSELEPVHS